ncbi:MAG: restriction endonuclease subunit S, partial [Alphaproteobacteria bacterium]|nr:restriction endonuclease subunit S [Alphaproteobacteria bacterium]
MAEQKYTISDIIETYISGDWGNDEPTEDASCPVSCIRGADIVPIYNSEYRNIPLRYISEKSLSNRALREGDIVIEKSGGSPTQSTGRVVYISKELLEEKQDIVCSNFCAAFRIKPEWDAKYVYYYLQHVYNAGVFFNFEGKTSGLKNLIMDTAFKSITIKKIAIETQRSIATVLSTIESKMAANRAINHYLEAMAKQLYDYWFVQFDFPDENGKPYKSSGGKMVWNEKLKREIPEGWSNVPLRDFADIYNGATPSTEVSSNYGGDIIWITPKDLSDQQSKFTYYGYRNITSAGYNSCSTRLLPAKTILLSSRAPIGLISIAMVDLCTNQGFKSLVCKDLQLYAYLYYYIRHHVKQIEQLGTGTTFKEVSREDLCTFPILEVKSTELMQQWLNQIEPIFMQQYELIKEINCLSKKRDELLPLLMNGQVSVRQLNNDL